MSIINAMGWQPLAINPLRSAAEAGAEQQAAFRAVVASSGTAAQQQSRGNTTEQNAEDARKEAFAKLIVQLQNLHSNPAEPSGIARSGGAAEEFRDYMALSPAEKIKLKLLNELGITQEEYDALPPEEQEKIQQKIVEQMKKETELQALATFSAQLQQPALSAKLTTPLTATESGQEPEPLA